MLLFKAVAPGRKHKYTRRFEVTTKTGSKYIKWFYKVTEHLVPKWQADIRRRGGTIVDLDQQLRAAQDREIAEKVRQEAAAEKVAAQEERERQAREVQEGHERAVQMKQEQALQHEERVRDLATKVVSEEDVVAARSDPSSEVVSRWVRLGDRFKQIDPLGHAMAVRINALRASLDEESGTLDEMLSGLWALRRFSHLKNIQDRFTRTGALLDAAEADPETAETASSARELAQKVLDGEAQVADLTEKFTKRPLAWRMIRVTQLQQRIKDLKAESKRWRTDETEPLIKQKIRTADGKVRFQRMRGRSTAQAWRDYLKQYARQAKAAAKAGRKISPPLSHPPHIQGELDKLQQKLRGYKGNTYAVEQGGTVIGGEKGVRLFIGEESAPVSAGGVPRHRFKQPDQKHFTQPKTGYEGDLDPISDPISYQLNEGWTRKTPGGLNALTPDEQKLLWSEYGTIIYNIAKAGPFKGSAPGWGRIIDLEDLGDELAAHLKQQLYWHATTFDADKAARVREGGNAKRYIIGALNQEAKRFVRKQIDEAKKRGDLDLEEGEIGPALRDDWNDEGVLTGNQLRAVGGVTGAKYADPDDVLAIKDFRNVLKKVGPIQRYGILSRFNLLNPVDDSEAGSKDFKLKTWDVVAKDVQRELEKLRDEESRRGDKVKRIVPELQGIKRVLVQTVGKMFNPDKPLDMSWANNLKPDEKRAILYGLKAMLRVAENRDVSLPGVKEWKRQEDPNATRLRGEWRRPGVTVPAPRHSSITRQVTPKQLGRREVTSTPVAWRQNASRLYVATEPTEGGRLSGKWAEAWPRRAPRTPDEVAAVRQQQKPVIVPDVKDLQEKYEREYGKVKKGAASDINVVWGNSSQGANRYTQLSAARGHGFWTSRISPSGKRGRLRPDGYESPEEANQVVRHYVSVPDDDEDTIKSATPYGHVAYLRTAPSGKVSYVQAKGVKPAEQTEPEEAEEATGDEEATSDEPNWKTLVNNGIVLPPPYKPKGIPVAGKVNAVAEEMCWEFSKYLLTPDPDKKPDSVARANFTRDLKRYSGISVASTADAVEAALADVIAARRAFKSEKKPKQPPPTAGTHPHLFAVVDGKSVQPTALAPTLFQGSVFMGSATHGERHNRERGSWIPARTFKDVILNGTVFPKDVAKYGGTITDPSVEWVVKVNFPAESGRKAKTTKLPLAGKIDRKWAETREFSAHYGTIMEGVSRDLRSNDPAVRERAACLALMDALHIRVGKAGRKKGGVPSIGATDLTTEHIWLDGNDLKFRFLAKAGEKCSHKTMGVRRLTPAVASILRKLGVGDAPVKDGQRVFSNTTPEALNAWIQEETGVPHLHAHNFRHHHAGLYFQEKWSELTAKSEKPKSKAEAKKLLGVATRHAGIKLGHAVEDRADGPTARKNYIDPRYLQKAMEWLGFDLSDKSEQDGRFSFSTQLQKGVTSEAPKPYYVADPCPPLIYGEAMDVLFGEDRPNAAVVKSIEYRGRTFPGYNKPVRSDRPEKKKMVLAKQGSTVKLIHFGQKGYAHNYSAAAKKNYLSRSAGIRDKSGRTTKDNKLSANYWARKVLWPKSLVANINRRKRLGLSRSKSRSTIDPEQYRRMQEGWKKAILTKPSEDRDRPVRKVAPSSGARVGASASGKKVYNYRQPPPSKAKRQPMVPPVEVNPERLAGMLRVPVDRLKQLAAKYDDVAEFKRFMLKHGGGFLHRHKVPHDYLNEVYRVLKRDSAKAMMPSADRAKLKEKGITLAKSRLFVMVA